MIRRLLKALTALSLLMCTVTMGVSMWGQFFSRGRTFGPQNDRFSCRLSWQDARLWMYACPGHVPQFALTGRSGSFAGVSWSKGNASDGTPIVAASTSQAQVWVVALLFSILPALDVRRRLLASRRKPFGACVACGYDLRATPGRCPECGTLAGKTVGVDAA